MNYELRSGVEIKVLKTMPKGWKETKGAMTAPRGTIMVDNGGSLFGKGGKRRESALVIVDEELFKESLKEKSGRKAKENQGLNKTVKPTVSPPAKKRTGVPKPPKKQDKPKKTYKNESGKIVYKQSTDKVGDKLVNQAGVEYTIAGERFHAPTGYDDGRLKVRVLQLKAKNGQIFELPDGEIENARKRGIFKRLSKQQKPPKAKTYTVAGRTFATKAEAQAFKALRKRKASKACEITEGTRKPTHKIVSFTAKNK